MVECVSLRARLSIRIAAASCAAGIALLVGGAGTPLAFAGPDDGAGGGGGSTGGGAGDGSGGSAPSGGTSGGASSGPTSGGGPSSNPGRIPGRIPGLPGGFGLPGAQFGNGRTGVTFGPGLTFGLPTKSTSASAAPTSKAKPTGTGTPEQSETGVPSESSSASSTAMGASSTATAAPTTSSGVPTVPVGVPSGGVGDPASWSWWKPCPPDAGNGCGASAGGSSSGIGLPAVPPLGLPAPLPQIPVQQLLAPVLDAVDGLAASAAALPFASLLLPTGLPPVDPGTAAVGGRGADPAGAPGPRPTASLGAGTPVTGRPDPTPDRGPDSAVQALGAGSESEPPAFRAGYGDYLRNAGTGQIAAVAVPGVSGIVAITAIGGLLGFRQARAGAALRSGGTSRFMT